MDNLVRKKIKETIEKYSLIEEGDTVVVGLSGGPDSLCLFDVLVDLAPEMDLTIHGAHVNHQFRPGAADEDQLFVENLCQNNGVSNWAISLDCNALAAEEGLTSEEAGRKARYEFFDSVANTIVEDGTPRERVKIAVAQNLNDQAETVLFRILRGTGTDGLGGIEYKRKTPFDNLIIRPLLDVSRSEIEAYCQENDLNPRLDETNYQPIYARNKIRLELIPYLEDNYNSNIIDVLNRLSNIAKTDKDYIWQEAEKVYDRAFISKEKNRCVLKLSTLQKTHSSVLNRVVMRAFSLIGLTKDISFVHLEQCERLIREGETSNRINLPSGYVIEISYDMVQFYRESSSDEVKAPKVEIKVVPIEEYEARPSLAAFDYGLIEAEYGKIMPTIRRRKAGDYIRIKGLGRKKLQNLFVDLKVPRNMRDDIYFAAIGSELLYIPAGFTRARYNDKYKVTEGTKLVLTVEFE